MKVYITTCNQFAYLVKGFAYLFNKYWSNTQEVVVLCYEEIPKDLPSNFSVHSMGKQPPNKIWSTHVKKYFSSIDDEYILFMVEDAFIINPVDKNVISHLLDFIKKNNIPKIEFGGVMHCYNKNRNIPFDYYHKDEYADLGKVPDHLGGIKNTFHPAIWERKYFVNMLKDGRDIWESEIMGGKEMEKDGKTVLSVFRPYPVIDTSNFYKHGVIVFDTPGSSVGTVNNSDVEKLKEMGIYQ